MLVSLSLTLWSFIHSYETYIVRRTMNPKYSNATCMAGDQENYPFPDPYLRPATDQAHLPKPRFAYATIFPWSLVNF